MFSTECMHADSLEIGIPSDNFKMLPLNKFCKKKFFEIGFINAANIEDESFIDQLLALNKTKEEITHVTFINEKEVTDFLQQVAFGDTEFEFPPSLMGEIKQFVDHIPLAEFNDTETMMEYQAYKLKFKLIQTMYEQYGNVVKEMRRQDILSKELDTLAEKKPTTRGKKSASDMRSTAKSGKRQGNEKEDYTEIDLMDSDLVVDDFTKNQVQFYVFRGFNNMSVIKHLLKIFVKLSFIVKVSEFEVDEKKHINHFWREYYFIRDCPCDFLQNIAVFKYQAPPHEDLSSMLETCLSELTEIIKSLIDYKRLHFHYIKNLKIVNTKFTETFRFFPIYEESMEDYPPEVITIPLILSSILREVENRHDKNSKTQSPKKIHRKLGKHKTVCPFDINSMLQPTKNKEENKKPEQTFRIYERDYINLTFKSYDNIDVQYVKDNLDVLKLQLPITIAQECNFEESLDDFQSHTHDIVIPSEDEPCFTDDQTTHLINLLYLKNQYFHDNEQENFENELTKNLFVFDKKKHMKNMLPKSLTEETWKIGQPFFDPYPDCNYYESLRPMSLHWAEILKPEVLFQYLLESEMKFICCDFIVCKLTNCLIVRYHNNVNSFGVHTKVWNEYLRTPVGLGDFCRFTVVEDYDWLKENGTYPQITYLEVVKMFEEHTAMYQYGNEANREYRYLLVPQVQYSNSDIRQSTVCPCIEENVCKILESCDANMEFGYPVLSANIESILKDIQEYNNVVDFSEHCKGKTDSVYSFVAYNFGVTKFSIIGHTTDFVSLDNVRVSVDTSRFRHENFKMTVKVTTENSLLVVHVPQNQFSCHITLSDDTIIVFSKPQPVKKAGDKTARDDSDYTLLDLEGVIDKMGHRKTIESQTSQSMFEMMQGDLEPTVTAVDFDHYSSLNLFPAVGNIIRQSPKEQHKRNIKKDIDLLRRLQQHTKCFKVSRRRSKKIGCVQSKIPETEIPLSAVVKRIIDKPTQLELCGTPRRKCVVKGGEPSRRRNLNYDCTVTAPNGLTLKVLPSEIQTNATVIKQSYDFEPFPKGAPDERFRMFTHDGTIIVGKLDGSIYLLMSSGREIRFTKPTNVKDDEMLCRVKKDLTDGLIKKLFTRMMAEHQDPEAEASGYFISRRGHLKSKYTSISSCENLKEVTKLPYSTISMITFEGEKIVIKNERLYKYHYSRHTTEINFQTEERCYRREDGFSAKIDRDGTQWIEFPDETTIKTTVNFIEEPIEVNKKDKMGWILVTCTFHYEHPYFKPVFYDNLNSVIEIRINEFDTLNIDPDGGILTMKNSTQIDLRKDYITFWKYCYNCFSQYKCSLYVEPLYQKRNLKEEQEFFINVEDTYKKTFKADFQGNCKIDPNYMNSAMNDNKCSHLVATDHQRIFLIKNNLEGMVLLNDKAASAAMRDSEEDKYIRHFNDERNTLIFLTITRNISTKFEERFFGKILRDMENFPKSSDGTNHVVYQTTRNLYSMFELDQIDGLMSCLRKFFQEEVMRDLVLSLSALKFHLASSKYSIHSLSQIYTVEEEAESEVKPVISLHEKLKEISKKMASVKRIMKMPLPNYFESKFSTYESSEKIASKLRIRSRASFPEVKEKFKEEE